MAEVAQQMMPGFEEDPETGAVHTTPGLFEELEDVLGINLNNPDNDAPWDYFFASGLPAALAFQGQLEALQDRYIALANATETPEEDRDEFLLLPINQMGKGKCHGSTAGGFVRSTTLKPRS